MEGHCLTGQSPQWAVVPMEEVTLKALTFGHALSRIILIISNNIYRNSFIQMVFIKDMQVVFCW